jgi:hypothetical protein
VQKQGSTSENFASRTKFIDLCTNKLGGLYNTNGTIEHRQWNDKKGTIETQLGVATLLERTHQRVRHQEILRQINLEAILEQAASQIDHTLPIHKPINQDWCNVFFNFAQDIAEKDMQSVWSRALSIEFKRPGTISKCSLKFLHGCDQWEVKAFKRVCKLAFVGSNGHPFIFREITSTHSEDPVFPEGRLLSHCVSSGLVKTGITPLQVGFSFRFLGEKNTVRLGNLPNGSELEYFVQQFSKIGSDLYRLIDTTQQDEESLPKAEVWEYLSDFLELEVESSSCD